MPYSITLETMNGHNKGRIFTFTEYDLFIFGRDPDCHACLPADDRTCSRHHFLLEVNPPFARLRDLGSLNGTYINDRKYGGRSEDESPEQAAAHKYPEVDLKNGDIIKVGETMFLVKHEGNSSCAKCGIEIPPSIHLRLSSRIRGSLLSGMR